MGVRTTAPWDPACEALQSRPKNTCMVGTVLTREAGPGIPTPFPGPVPCLGFRLSSKPLLTSDDYELGAGMRKRHKGPEEDHDALGGAGKARGRNQPWDEHETSSDFMSQVGCPISQVCCWLEAEGLAGLQAGKKE